MLFNRESYAERAMLFRDIDLVKVVTGVRRCGKTSLLELVRGRIEAERVPGRAFVSVNLESRGTGISSDDDLYAYVKERLSPESRTYVCIDEAQRIEGWHDVVNASRPSSRNIDLRKHLRELLGPSKNTTRGWPKAVLAMICI